MLYTKYTKKFDDMLPANWFFPLVLIFLSQMSWATNVKQLLFFLAVSFSNCRFFLWPGFYTYCFAEAAETEPGVSSSILSTSSKRFDP